MKKFQYAMIIISFVCAVGAAVISFYLEKDFVWPALVAIWTGEVFYLHRTIDRYESRHGIKD